MGIYVITGATSGIGAKTAEILRERGHEVVNIDLNGGDINANLATKEGRAGAIAELHERFPEGIDAMICNPAIGHVYYASTKYALARWVRRMSPDWGSRGVRLNAIAPGNVRTAMTANMLPEQRAAMEAIPVPTHFGEEPLMDPVEIANAMAFIASPEASGINGVVLFVDGGTDALLNSEKVY